MADDKARAVGPGPAKRSGGVAKPWLHLKMILAATSAWWDISLIDSFTQPTKPSRLCPRFAPTSS